jgi:hypothetical protein
METFNYLKVSTGYFFHTSTESIPKYFAYARLKYCFSLRTRKTMETFNYLKVSAGYFSIRVLNPFQSTVHTHDY